MRNSTANFMFARSKRQGFALVATLLLITLLIAVTSQLATQSCVESARAARRQRSLQHELAVDSAILLFGDRLAASDSQATAWIRDLDQTGSALLETEIGDAKVYGILHDDGAKLNPLFWSRLDQASVLTRKLSLLAERRRTRDAEVSLRPLPTGNRSSRSVRAYRWFDQLFDNVLPGAFFCLGSVDEPVESASTWSAVLTLWGDGRVDLRRVDAEVLEAVLEDIQPGLGRSMLKARRSDRSMNFLAAALIDVPAEIRPQVANRLTFDAKRYALRLQTAVGGDRREWYAVLQVDGRSAKVLHRSQITW